MIKRSRYRYFAIILNICIAESAISASTSLRNVDIKQITTTNVNKALLLDLDLL